jgi:hypothetical protein
MNIFVFQTANVEKGIITDIASQQNMVRTSFLIPLFGSMVVAFLSYDLSLN